MHGVIKFFAYLSLVVIALFSSGIALAAIVFHIFGSDLPDHNKLQDYSPPQTTYIISSDARLITSYAVEKRIYVELNQMPKIIINAFLAAEDKSFYDNVGIDIMGMVRAVLITSQGKRIAGGSTITQQLVKNFFLTNERTVTRKIKEIILAFRITRTFDKDKILELYLNKIYLGNGTYGVAAASIGYFNKSLEDLNVNEAAILASLPKSPSKLDPYKSDNHENLLQRRNWVIGRMLEEGYINKYEAMAAKTRGIELERSQDRYIDHASYFGDEVRQKIVEMYGQDCLYSCGLNIFTTINPSYQEMAYTALRQGLVKFDRRKGYRGPITNIQNELEKFDSIAAKIDEENELNDIRVALITKIEKDELHILLVGGKTGIIHRKDVDWSWGGSDKRKPNRMSSMHDWFTKGDVVLVTHSEIYNLAQIPKVNGAIVVLDTKTSRVLAMVGGYDYKTTKFNRATQAKRQPGSVFKPFVYLTALAQNNVTPVTMMEDEPIVVDQGPGLPKWAPRNFKDKYYGTVNVRRGLEQSINSITVKLILKAGLKNVINTAKKFGIYSGRGKHLSIALGSEAIDLLSMTNAYAMIANGGKKTSPSLIEIVQDSSGKIIYRRDNRDCPACTINDYAISDNSYHIPPAPDDTRPIVMDPVACYQTLSIMEGVIQNGTGRSTKMKNKHIAGKTGTTNDSKDTWFVGLTNEIVVGVYVGYDEPSGMGEKETGARVALPIFKSFMGNVNVKAGPFEAPVGVNLIKIDRLTGNISHSDSNNDPYVMEAFRIGTEPES